MSVSKLLTDNSTLSLFMFSAVSFGLMHRTEIKEYISTLLSMKE
tara:strand:+ start:548 stop:679 length:132 start_codon:yes stop_codon:yes gene_type:complete